MCDASCSCLLLDRPKRRYRSGSPVRASLDRDEPGADLTVGTLLAVHVDVEVDRPQGLEVRLREREGPRQGALGRAGVLQREHHRSMLTPGSEMDVGRDDRAA